MMKTFVLLALCSIAAAQFGGRVNDGYGPGRLGPGGTEGFSARGGGGNGELSYEAKGRLTCGLIGVDKVRVVLWDRFRGRDNIIYDEGMTDVVGNFRLRATRNTIDGNRIQPFLTIYHDCDDASNPGLRKMTVQLPPQYTNQGQLALKSFDIGTWNLETSFTGEETEMPDGEAGGRPIGGAFQHTGRGFFGSDRDAFRPRERPDFDEPINV